MDSRLSAKNVKLARPTLFNYLYTRDELEKYANELFEMMSKDKMNVRIHEIYPLEDVARAHNVSSKLPPKGLSVVCCLCYADEPKQDIEGRKTTGKLLLRP